MVFEIWRIAAKGSKFKIQNAHTHQRNVLVWSGMVEVCEGAPVAVSGWVLTDRHDLGPCAANSLHRETIH